MNIFDKFKAGWNSMTSEEVSVVTEAAAVPSIPLPKSPTGQQAQPSYRTVVGGTTSLLLKPERGLLNSDRLGVRNAQGTQDALRQLSYSSPDMSAAIYATLRVGIPEKYTVVARNMDGQIDPASTALAQELLRRITYLGNVDGSYGPQMSIQSLSESLGKELMIYGACSGEVALDKARIPASLNAVSTTKVRFFDEDMAYKPIQYIGGTEIDLDIPTFIYVALDQDLLSVYSGSPLESSLQPVLADLDFNNDMRRALKRAVLPRLVATIDSDAVKKSTPPEILNDSDKFATYKQALIGAVQGVVNGANPEDALISFSEISYAFVDGGGDPSSIIEKMQGVLNSKMQTGVKTLPVVLGHGGTSAAGSTEALLFLKNANMIRVKLNEFYSRALTVAVRVMGQDCYVEFEYVALDLRPDAELEAYKMMKQSRILEQLSLGFISDEEASIALTGNLPPAGYKPLMGTMFKAGTAGQNGAAQPGTAASGTSGMSKGAGESTPAAPKSGTGPKPKAEVAVPAIKDTSEIDNLMTSHREAMAALQDMAFAVARTANKPVEVTVAPSELHLTLASDKEKSAKTVKVVRDAEGKFSGMEVT